MNNFIFHNLTKVIFGKGTTKTLAAEMNAYGKNVLLVYGGGSIRKNGLYDTVIAQLSSKNVFELSGVEPNPKVSTVNKGIEICRRQNIDFILAVGGGSTLDCAKAIGIGSKYSGDVWDFYSGKAEVQSSLPVGTVLTMAGTGTEMNCFSVITNDMTKEKTGVGGYECMYPVFSILDPCNTISLPIHQTVNGCVDMMSHVMEAYFSYPEETPLQDGISETVLKNVIQYAPRLLINPADYEARQNIMWSGTLALHQVVFCGKDADWGCHHIEELLSGYYDIAHGAGLAVLLPWYMRYMNHYNSSKYRQYAINVFGVDPTGKTDQEIGMEGINRTEAFFRSLGAPATLEQCGVTDVDIEMVAEKAVQNGPIGVYAKMGRDEVANLLCKVLT